MRTQALKHPRCLVLIMNYYAYQVPMLSDRLYVCPNALSGQCNGYICGLVHPGMCVVMCVYVCVLWCVLSVCLGMAQIRCSSIPLCIQSHISVVMWTTPSRCAGISSGGTAIETNVAIAIFYPI